MARLTEEELEDARIEARREEMEERGPRRYRCGGPGSYEGSCGALDCETCYPGGLSADEDDGPSARRAKLLERIKEAKESGESAGIALADYYADLLDEEADDDVVESDLENFADWVRVLHKAIKEGR